MGDGATFGVLFYLILWIDNRLVTLVPEGLAAFLMQYGVKSTEV